MRRFTSLIATALALGLAAAPALAQTGPAPFPWERKTDAQMKGVFGDPTAGLRGRDERALRKLGLPPNARLGRPRAAAAEDPAAAALARYVWIDADRDGYISRGEYFAARLRPRRVGSFGMARGRAQRARIDSRFRSADRNRDGRISADELAALRNPRF